jgi:O-antigen ligase
MGGAVAGAALFAFAYTNGGYSLTTQGYASLAVWWVVGFVAAIGLQTMRYSTPPLGRATAALLAGFAGWTVLSLAWASDDERAFHSFTRVILYLGVFTLALGAGRVVRRATLVAGVAAAMTAILCVALGARFFSGAFGSPEQSDLLSVTSLRLSFPIGYWNGLAIFAALLLPVLLALAVSARVPAGRVLALAPAPLIGAVIYLASSRGAVATAAVGVGAFVVASRSRWPSLGAAVVASLGAVAGVAIVLHGRTHAAGQVLPARGAGPALELLVACLATLAAWELVQRAGRRVGHPPALLGWALAGVVVVVCALAALAAHPVARFRAFKGLPQNLGAHDADYVRAHLLSSSGSGRWQFWTVAANEFRAHPLNGGGAGSFEAWWGRHRPISLFIVDAHSLYLQALAELGIVGLALIVGAFLCGAVGAFREARSDRRVDELGAGLAACFLAFAAAASFDWMWELPAVAVVGLVALGLALSPGIPEGRSASSRLGGARVAVSVLSVVGMVVGLMPLLAQLHLHSSQAAVRRDDLAAATHQALQARALEPWAASPYTQLALVAEQARDLPAANKWIARAIDHAPDDWRVHLIAARLATESLHLDRARRELAAVHRLNPALLIAPPAK